MLATQRLRVCVRPTHTTTRAVSVHALRAEKSAAILIFLYSHGGARVVRGGSPAAWKTVCWKKPRRKGTPPFLIGNVVSIGLIPAVIACFCLANAWFSVAKLIFKLRVGEYAPACFNEIIITISSIIMSYIFIWQVNYFLGIMLNWISTTCVKQSRFAFMNCVLNTVRFFDIYLLDETIE